MDTRSRLIILLLCVSAAHAQYLVNAPVGMIYFTEGEVYLNAQPVQAPLPEVPAEDIEYVLKFPVMTNGQVLRTGSGRAEVLLAPGVFLRLDSQAAMKMLDNRLEDTQAELQKGTALIEVVQLPRMAVFKSSWEKRQRRSKVWGYTDSKRTHENCAYSGEALR